MLVCKTDVGGMITARIRLEYYDGNTVQLGEGICNTTVGVAIPRLGGHRRKTPNPDKPRQMPVGILLSCTEYSRSLQYSMKYVL